MGRKEARESAFKILYQMDVNKSDPLDTILSIYYQEFSVAESDKGYINDVVHGVCAHLDEIDKYLVEGVKSWTLKRISKVDKAILRLALYEIFYREDIPESISIYEAVELVKKFDSEEAGGFVNGILRGVLRKTKADGEDVE